MKIGDPVWLFDDNRRVYPEGGRTFGGGGPIYREHFVEMVISGETAKSWIVSRGRCEHGKIPKIGDGDTRAMKNGAWRSTIYLSRVAVEDDIYCHDNRVRIADDVRRADAATLRAIDALLKAPPVKG